LVFARARPGRVEAPAVLRLEAQAKCLLELKARRGDAVPREAHQKARGDDGALADRRRFATRDVAPVEIDLVVEIGGNVELAVGRHRGSKAPGEPAILATGSELERRDQRERIA